MTDLPTTADIDAMLGLTAKSTAPDTLSELPSTDDIDRLLGLTGEKETDWWAVAVGKKALAETTPGLALRAMGVVDYEEQDLGLVGNTIAGIGGFLLDPLTYVGGVAGGAVGKQVGKRFAAGYGRTMLEHGIQGAVQLGGLELGRDPLRQYIHTGEVDPAETALNVGRAGILGAGFGPLAPIGGPARIAAESVMLGVGDPLLHGEKPTAESMLSGFATVVGLKSVNALVRIGKDGRQKLIDYRNGRREAGFADASPSAKEFRELGLDELADKPRSVRNAAVDAAEEIQTIAGAPPREVEPQRKPGLETGKPLTAEEAARAAAELSQQLGRPVEPVTETRDASQVRRNQEVVPGQREIRQDVQEGRVGDVREAGGQVEEGAVGGGQATEARVKEEPRGVVALKNASTDAERKAMGLPPAMERLRQSDPVVFDKAMREIESVPGRQDVLIDDLKKSPRPATPVENALLLHREVDLRNERNKASLATETARERGDATAEAAYDAQVSLLNTKLEELFGVIESSGTEAGRSFRLRQLWADEDFSLRGTDRQMRLATEGKPTDAERDIARKAADEYSKTQKKLESAESAEGLLRAGHEAVRETTFRVEKKQGKRAEQAKKEVDDAWKDLLDKMGPGTTPALGFLNPETYASAVRLAKAYVKLGVATAADFIAEVRARIGEKAAKQAEDDLTKAWNEAVAEAKPKPKREIKTDRQLSNFARKLLEFHVERGARRLKDALDAVHADLRTFDPSISRRAALEAMSGYGQFTPAPTDELKRKVYDLRRQGQEVSKLQDIKERRPPRKTGKGRPEPTETERQLTKRVRERMKQAGLESTDPGRQLKSALASTKTRLRNRIADLSRALKTKTPIVRGTSRKLSDSEIVELTRHRDDLQRRYDELFKRRGLSDEQRLKLAISAERRMAREYRRRIEAGEFGPRPKKPGLPFSAEYDAARTERTAAKAQFQHLKDLANPKKTPEERAMSAYHANLRRRIAAYQRRIADQDLEPRPKRLPPRDSESELLRQRLELIKREFIKEVEKARRRRRTNIEKVFGLIPESANAARAMLTSLDFSAVLRQGGFVFAAHPIRSIRAMPDMFRAFVSEAGMSRAFYELSNRTNARNGLYKRSGLEFTDPSGPLSRMEEAFMSRWAERIPGVAGSQRAYITFLNRVRADSFDAMSGTIGKVKTISEAEAKVVANFVNAATGRGNLWKFTQASTALATVFFAPRYVVSRFQILMLQPLWRGGLDTRKAIAKEYARALTGLGVFYGVSSFALQGLLGPPGDEWGIELDPRSSDFGKIRIGDTRIDPLAGFQQAAVLLERLRTGETKNLRGRVRPLRGDVPYGSPDAADVIARFLRTKLSPPIGTSIDVLTGKDVVGDPVTAASVARRATIPLSMQDTYEAMVAQGIPAGTALGLLAIFGMNIQTYEGK